MAINQPTILSICGKRFLTLMQSRGNNRLWLRCRNYTIIFILSVDWAGPWPGFRSKGAKNYKEGSNFFNTRLDVCSNRGSNIKWGNRFEWGAGHHWSPRWRRPWAWVSQTCASLFRLQRQGRINHSANRADARGLALQYQNTSFYVFRLFKVRRNSRAFWWLRLVYKLRKPTTSAFIDFELKELHQKQHHALRVPIQWFQINTD